MSLYAWERPHKPCWSTAVGSSTPPETNPRGGATDVRAPTGTVTLCIARVGNTAAVWVNGKAWVQAMILASDGLPGIGVAGGVAVVESVAFAAQTEVGK